MPCMTHAHQPLHAALLLLVLLAAPCCLQAAVAPARDTSTRPLLPVCAASKATLQGAILQPTSSCVFDVTRIQEAQQLQLLGASGARLPTVLLQAPAGAQAPQGLATAAVSDVILEAVDSFPNHAIDLATLLRPPHIAGSSTAVNLTNVVLLHTVSGAQAAVGVATLRGIVSDPIVQRGVADWSLQLYTDYVSYVYIGSFSAPGLTCNGCGVFLQFSDSSSGSSSADGRGGSSGSDSDGRQLPTLTPDQPRPAVNYLLNVDNSSFVPALMRFASISSPRPFLVLLSSNVTWGRHPALQKAPEGYMQVNRPAVIVGQHGHLTAVDLGMVANGVHLTGTYSNVTLHGVVVENQGFGDKQSGSQAAGLSIMNPFNVWLFYWPRLDARVVFVNATTVAAHQELVQYLIYWQIMTSSSDPAMRAEAAWVQRGPGITVWEAVVYPRKMLELKFVCRTSIAKDTWRVSSPLVFPQLPDNVDDPRLYQTGLQAHRAAPLASLAGSDAQLQRWLTTLSGLPREGLSMIITPSVSLGPSDANSWPPAGDIVLKAPRTVMVGQRVCELPGAGSSSSSSSSSGGSSGVTINGHRAVAEQMPQRGLLEGLGLSAEAAAAAVRCSAANSSDAEAESPLMRLSHSPVLDWAQDTSLLQLQPSGSSGVLELNTLTLLGLSQGPGVGATSSEGAAGVGRRLRAFVAVVQFVGSSSDGRRLGHRLLRWQDPRQRTQPWEEYHRQQAFEDRQWQGPWQQAQLPQGSKSNNGSSSSSSSSRGGHRYLLAADGAAAARGSSAALTQADVRVWTHLVWAVMRAASGQLVLRNVAMGLPEPEFKRLLAASRGAPGGAFNIPLEGGGALSAKSSSYLDNCCLSVSSYTAPSMNATSLLLFVDPDSSRSTPPGYVWPYDGAEGGGSEGAAAAGSTSAGRQGLSSAGLAGLIVGVVAAAVLAALLIWLLAARQRRQRQYGRATGGMYKLSSPLSVDMHQSSNNSGYSSTAQGMYSSKQAMQQYLPAQDGRPVADVAVVGAGALDDQQQSCQQGFSQSGSGSGTLGPMGSVGTGNTVGQSIGGTGSTGDNGAVPGTRRWQKLTTAISSKVQDIHQQRLRTAFMQSQHAGSGSSALAGAAAAGAVGAAATKGVAHGVSSRSSQGGGVQQPPQAHVPGVGDGGSSGALQFAAGCGSSSSGTLSHSGTAVAAVGGAALGGCEGQQGDGRNALALKELIGRGTFGTVYRAAWQGVDVAVKLLQLPPGTERTMTESGLLGGSEATAGLLRAVGGWGNAAGDSQRDGNLLKHEHMAVQEAAIGSCMMHPNIVSVYSISLQPSSLPGPLPATAPSAAAGGGSSAPGLLLLREDGTALVGSSDLAAAAAASRGGALDLLPWCMQLVMELCDRGTLREALDAGLLATSKSNGLHELPTVLSLAHNVACAMAYLHQEHIIHGDLKASNVLLKTCAPTTAAAAAPGMAAGQQASAAAAAGDPQGAAAASRGIMDAAAAAAVAADEVTSASGMRSLLKCGWVVAKVSDFGLSMCVNPEETHVSSVHAGTLTHMAPEMLMHGRCSRASDVYAFGILLWEVATGGKAFAGIPKPLLGHCVISQGMRPTWPPAMRPCGGGTSSSSSEAGAANGAGGGTAAVPAAGTGPWADLVSLTERCWAQDPQARPTFCEVVQQLSRLLRDATSSQGGGSSSTVAAAARAAPTAAAAAAAAAGGSSSVGQSLLDSQWLQTRDTAAGSLGASVDSPAASRAVSSSAAAQNPAGVGAVTLNPAGVGGAAQNPEGPLTSPTGARGWSSGLFGDRHEAAGSSSAGGSGGPPAAAPVNQADKAAPPLVVLPQCVGAPQEQQGAQPQQQQAGQE